MQGALELSVAAQRAKAPRRSPTTLAWLVPLLLLASGCGQKGPLVLPATAAAPAASSPAPR